MSKKTGALVVAFWFCAGPTLATTIHEYSDLAISQDGSRTATIELATAGNDHQSVIERSTRDGHVLARVDPCRTCSYADLAFAPDGRVAFLARDRVSDTVTLETTSGEDVHAIATIHGIASAPRFSPDGRRIALLVTLGARKQAGATSPGARMVGEIGDHEDERRIAVFDVDSSVAAVEPVSPPGRYIYEYDWTPDGRGFVATTALGNGDDNWWIATLDAIDAKTGAVREITAPRIQMNFPRVSPDGRAVAFIGGLMSDFGSVGGDVYTVPFEGGRLSDITRGSHCTYTSLFWLKSGLITTALASDTARIDALSDGPHTTLWKLKASFSAADGRIALSNDGKTVATVVQDFEHAPAIYAGPTTAPRPITHDNDALHSAGRATSVEWHNDGRTMQGWLLAPKRANVARKAAMITIVHGGPASAAVPRFEVEGTTTEFLKAGYYIFMPNPRGSFGQGEEFVRANRHDFGRGDLRDILSGIDAVEKVAPVDDARLGLTGISYGGFMAMWANTHTSRFKAIVAGAGISDWVSYYGINGIDQWMLPYLGRSAYDDPRAYTSMSPVRFVKQAHTPTFIYVGESDIEVPPTQSVEWWHALKAERVPVSLVIYPGEGHVLRKHEHLVDMRRRALALFNRYL